MHYHDTVFYVILCKFKILKATREFDSSCGFFTILVVVSVL